MFFKTRICMEFFFSFNFFLLSILTFFVPFHSCRFIYNDGIPSLNNDTYHTGAKYVDKHASIFLHVLSQFRPI